MAKNIQKIKLNTIEPVAPELLEWYHQHRRILPFRENPTPYNIWVSEIMLQQTRVSAALAYYERFTKTLPNVAALAACSEEKLHKLWQGLGYYSRVRNMQKAAKIVVEKHGGELPGSYDALLALPGIGEYTAGAIGSIAFGLPVVAVDGNVLRVFSRLLDSDADITAPPTKKALAAAVQVHQPPQQAGDYNQALMELGALVCTPGMPNCAACPLQKRCLGYQSGRAGSLPVKPPKKEKQAQGMRVLVVHSTAGVLLQQRPDTGLLAGLWQPLLLEGACSEAEALAALQSMLPGARILGTLPGAKHIFTHKIWQLCGWLAEAPAAALPAGYVWATPAEVENRYSVPSAFHAYLPYLLGPPQ